MPHVRLDQNTVFSGGRGGGVVGGKGGGGGGEQVVVNGTDSFDSGRNRPVMPCGIVRTVGSDGPSCESWKLV